MWRIQGRKKKKTKKKEKEKKVASICLLAKSFDCCASLIFLYSYSCYRNSAFYFKQRIHLPWIVSFIYHSCRRHLILEPATMSRARGRIICFLIIVMDVAAGILGIEAAIAENKVLSLVFVLENLMAIFFLIILSFKFHGRGSIWVSWSPSAKRQFIWHSNLGLQRPHSWRWLMPLQTWRAVAPAAVRGKGLTEHRQTSKWP